jgi:5'-nucleotidase
VDGRLVTSAGAYGGVVTAIDVAIDRATRDVVAAEARNHVVETIRYPADAAIAAHVARFAKMSEARAGRVVGTVRGEFTPVTNAAGESDLGALVAQAQLATMREVAGARIAFTNPGSLRAPLASRRPDGGVTFGELFAVQPFGNTLVAVTLSGAQILRLLEQQWRKPPDRVRILPVDGLTYAWDGTRPIGSRVVPGSVRVGDEPLAVERDYRVAVNSYLFGGGDGFSVFGEGREPIGGPGDVEALERFIAAAPRLAGVTERRIRRVDPPPGEAR